MAELPLERNIRTQNLRGPQAFPIELQAPQPGQAYVPTSVFLIALLHFTGECGALEVADAVRAAPGADRSGSKPLQFIADLGADVVEDNNDLALAIRAYFRENGYTADRHGSFAAALDLYATRMSVGLVHPIVGAQVICWHGDQLRCEDSDVDEELAKYDTAIDQWLHSDASIKFLPEAELLGLAKSHLRHVRPTIPWTNESPPDLSG